MLKRKKKTNLIDNISEIMTCAKRSSIERRTARSILYSSKTYKQIGEMGLHVNEKYFYEGKADFKTLITTGYLSTIPRTLQTFSPQQADFAIAFIFSSDNVSFMSWGTRTITSDDTKHSFPSINRKKSKTHNFEEYMRLETPLNKMNRSTYFDGYRR